MAVIRRPAPRRRLGGGGGRNATSSASRNHGRMQCLLRCVLYPPTLLVLLLAAFAVVQSIGRDNTTTATSTTSNNAIVGETSASGGLRRSKEVNVDDNNAVDNDHIGPPAHDDSTKLASNAISTESDITAKRQREAGDVGNIIQTNSKNNAQDKIVNDKDDGPNEMDPGKDAENDVEIDEQEHSRNVANDKDEDDDADEERPKQSPNTDNRPSSIEGWPAECALYLAESTIPNSGMGMFTAIDLPSGSLVGSPDIAVPIIDVDWHNQARYRYEEYHFIYENYFWSAQSMRMVDIAESVGVMSHGFGALANSHQGLMNMDEGLPRYDIAGLHRSRDVGAGQFSPYHDREVRTSAMVPAGSELFVDYGESWFTSRTDSFGYLPMGGDYNRADTFLKTFDKFDKSKLSNSTHGKPISIEIKKEYWDLIRNFYPKDDSRVVNALPHTLDGAETAIKGGIRDFIREIRSPEWFQENGKCLDNIRPQPSTIKQAGRGAFATRFIPKGGLVITAPLIQVPRGRELFKMYEMNVTDSKGNFVRGDPNSTSHTGYQLMMNYAFGHPESSVFLTPYGPSVSFINHNATAANTKMQWADPKDEWLRQSVEWLEMNTTGAQLSLDFIATRDILPGEEVFLDYGDSWQRAWDDHVTKWSPPPGSDKYLSATDMNSDTKGKYEVLLTSREQQSLPYPDNIQTMCRYRLPKKLERNANVTKLWNKSHASGKLHPCEILSKSATQISSQNGGGQSTLYLYTAKILENKSFLGQFGDEDKLPGVPRRRSFTLTGMPRAAIQFGNKLYSNDIFLPNSFRHEIVVPDDVWPESWKNLGEKKTDKKDI